MAVGTPHYLSPEQIGERPVDHRTDIYALGVVLFQILTGRFPFDAINYAALVTKILHEPPISADTLRPDVPSGLAAVISRMLAKKPEQRFADMRELSAALAPFQNAPSQFSSFMSDAPTQIATPEAWESQSNPSALSIASRKRIWVGAGIGVTIALTSTLWLIATRQDDAPPSAPRMPTTAAPAAKASKVQRAVPAPVPVAEPPAPAPASPAAAEAAPPKPVLQPLQTPMVITRPRPSTKPPGEASSLERPAKPAPEPAAPPPRVGAPYELQAGNPYRSGTPAKPVVQPGPRMLILRNTSRAAVTVELDCGGFTAARTIAAGKAETITRPQRTCRVRCTGIGRPRCPGAIESAASSMAIQ
jgi:serine/threonine-protein kinase